jgi:signal transduction histidine kinase
VSPGALEHLFEKFYRASATQRGSGIGLAVVRGLGEAGGARVSARASELGGLAIDLDLPIVADALATAGA